MIHAIIYVIAYAILTSINALIKKMNKIKKIKKKIKNYEIFTH